MGGRLPTRLEGAAHVPGAIGSIELGLTGAACAGAASEQIRDFDPPAHAELAGQPLGRMMPAP